MSSRTFASLAALGAVVVWGGSFAATKRGLTELSPATLLFTRTVVAAIFVGAALAVRGRLRPLPTREWPALVALSVAGLVATQLLQAWALTRSTSANTAWLVGLSPIVTAMGGALLLGERLAGKLGGLALAFAGAMLVVSGRLSRVTRGRMLAGGQRVGFGPDRISPSNASKALRQASVTRRFSCSDTSADTTLVLSRESRTTSVVSRS